MYHTVSYRIVLYLEQVVLVLLDLELHLLQLLVLCRQLRPDMTAQSVDGKIARGKGKDTGTCQRRDGRRRG